jgi:uncharacterized protein
MMHDKIDWKQIGAFYVVAVAFSAIFRLDVVNLRSAVPLPAGLGIYFLILKAIGPIAGFFFVRYGLKNRQDTGVNTLLGNDKKASLAAIAVIPLMMTLLGVKNAQNLNIHYYGFLYSTMFVGYALFEEYGWRGYLQNALSPMPVLARILAISVLWYVWHLNFINSDMSLQQHLMHFAFLVLGAWGLLRITEKTKSLLFATAIHLSFNLLTEVNGEFQKRLVVLVVAIAVWTGLLVFLSKKEKLI